jgi:hypothetical protein
MAEPMYDVPRAAGITPALRPADRAASPPGRAATTRTPTKHGHQGKGHQ